jgi:hypothetical protein
MILQITTSQAKLNLTTTFFQKGRVETKASLLNDSANFFFFPWACV